jgi:DNA-binding Xre family transcriptional regulator
MQSSIKDINFLHHKIKHSKSSITELNKKFGVSASNLRRIRSLKKKPVDASYVVVKEIGRQN